MKAHKNRRLDITERKLGRHKALGLFYPGCEKIEIDPTLLSRKYLYVLVHELLHMAFPDLSEEGVIRSAKVVAKGVWQQGYRRLQK